MTEQEQLDYINTTCNTDYKTINENDIEYSIKK